MIYVYFSRISRQRHHILIKEYLPRFSVGFQHKIRKYKRWQDAQLSLLGRMLLFYGIKNIGLPYRESDLKYTAYHKPHFKDSSIKFNISHAQEIVVSAINYTHEIGVDIEFMQDIQIADFRSQMTKDEWNRIAFSNDKTSAFYTYWTQKEAVIKAHGKGLSIPLKSFEVLQNETCIYTQPFYLRKIELAENYICHIASGKTLKEDHIQIRNITFSTYEHLL